MDRPLTLEETASNLPKAMVTALTTELTHKLPNTPSMLLERRLTQPNSSLLLVKERLDRLT